MSRLSALMTLLIATGLSAQTPPAAPVAPTPRTPRATPAPAVRIRSSNDYGSDYDFNDYSYNTYDYAQSFADLGTMRFNSIDLNDRLGEAYGALDRINVGGDFSYAGRSGPVAWAHDDPADSLYRQARDLLNRGDYRKAADLFKSLPQKYPASVYIPDAQYWQAFSLYRIGGTPELQEALAVLDARKPPATGDTSAATNASRAARAARATYTYDASRAPRAASDDPEVRVSTSTSVNGSISRANSVYRGNRVDAAGLAARIAGVLSSRGLANDAAVKRALAAGGNSCDPDDQSVRAEALSALMQNDPETGRQMAVKILANRDECSIPLRRNAVMLVGSKHDDAAVATLIPVAKSDPSDEVRMSAMEYLVRSSSDAALTTVIELAHANDNADIQRGAVMALTQSTAPRARTEIRALVENPATDESLRSMALEAFDRDRITADDATWLRGLYAKAPSDRFKERIIETVSRAGGDANNQWLAHLVSDENEPLEMRSSALRQAGRTMDIPALVHMYDASSVRPIRETLIELLSDRKEPEALDKLVDIAKNGTDPSMRRLAIASLARSKDPRASKLLLQLVDQK